MAKNGFFKKTYRKAKGAASEKYEEYKREKAMERAASKQIKAKAKAAGYRERETQAIRYAKESERYKTSQRLKTMKQPRPSYGGNGLSYLMGPTTSSKRKGNGSSAMNQMLGVGGGMPTFYGTPSKKKGKKGKDPLSRMVGI